MCKQCDLVLWQEDIFEFPVCYPRALPCYLVLFAVTYMNILIQVQLPLSKLHGINLL